MSRIGLKPVAFAEAVKPAVQGAKVAIKGPKGELTLTCPAGITVEVDAAARQLIVRRDSEDAQKRALHGTVRSLINNMVIGVTQGYQKDLEIQGVGFKAALQGQKLVLNLGYSHPIEFPVPAGIKIEVKDGVNLAVSGCDKHLVGEVAAQIRGFYKAEPYKGKGVRYKGEHVRRKAGKTVA